MPTDTRRRNLTRAPSRNPSPPDGLVKLPRSFYLRPTLAVARDLIGCTLIRRSRRGCLAGRIVEVEAYLGSRDPASHSYRGRTARNDVMFWEGGHLYVYFTYGMHYCCNVVTGREGLGHAVLIRALEPAVGIDEMRRNRRTAGTVRDLCSGPARICQAMHITRRENGTDLCGATIWIASDRNACRRPRVRRSPRIGIRHGREHRWRFTLAGSPFLSRDAP